MTKEEVIKELETYSSEGIRKVVKKHGACESFCDVKDVP